MRIGLGVSVSSPAEFEPVLAGIEENSFDSLWLPELLSGATLDPMVALSWAGARHPRLKLGTTMLLPGRNIIRLAKQLASLDSLSAGRLLVTFVSGINRGVEADVIGVPLRERRPAIEEGLPLLRELLGGGRVTHEGRLGSFAHFQLSPLPVQQPLEFWTGGSAAKSLQLCGELADGWLPSLISPAQAAAGRATVEAAAAAAGRAIDPEHFGVSIGYSQQPLDAEALARFAARAPGVDPRSLAPVGFGALRQLLTEFIDVGFSKFVVRPMAQPTSGSSTSPDGAREFWSRELASLADAVLDLQT
ncbi:MAG: putative oxidoreductase [Frankiales bacterium]|nr:putative oxidoreductase [Frankiales bacterium]